MRILVHDYAGHPFQVQLSRELARLGHTVLHAFAGELQTPRGDLECRPSDPSNFKVTRVAMNPDYRRYKYHFLRRRQMEIEYGREAARLVGSWNPDAVISSNTPTEAQNTLILKAQHKGTRFVSWVQDVYSVAVDELLRRKIPLVGGLAGSYYKRLDRTQLQQSHHIVAIADDFKSLLVRQFDVPHDKVSVIPNWAPIESLPPLPKQNPWSESQGLDDKFTFLYSGTLGMKHNPELLLQLARRHRDDPETRIVVISEGMGADWLKAESQRHDLQNLLLLPYQPFSEMPQVLASGDVLMAILEPSAGTFSVPSKVLTYLCAGRPLLLAVPDENLAARVVTGAEAGETVAPNDVQGFLEAADRLVEQDSLRDRYARNARDYAEKTFQISRIAIEFENILKN